MKLLPLSALALTICSAAFSVSAQELIGVQEQIDALKEEMIILQRKVYRESTDSPIADAAGKAEVKLGEYDQMIRSMNGKIDEMEHQIKQLGERIEAINQDTDIRFKLLEGKPIPAAENSDNSMKKFAPAVANGAPKAIVGDEVTSQELNNLTPEKKNLSVEQIYTQGLEALKAGKSAEAEQSFSLILEKYGTDKLAGNAQYWLGEVYYNDKNFAKAAVAFGRGYDKYKNGTKGADCLLKLGLSMEQLGKKDEACLAFVNLPKEFPNAGKTILDKAAGEAKKLGCQ